MSRSTGKRHRWRYWDSYSSNVAWGRTCRDCFIQQIARHRPARPNGRRAASYDLVTIRDGTETSERPGPCTAEVRR